MTKSDVIKYQKDHLLYLAIDFLPCELAFDASNHFSTNLKEWIPFLAESPFDESLNSSTLPPELQNAVIA